MIILIYFRCKSPDELGSHMSTLKCQNCEMGWIMPDCQIYNENETKYYCHNCDNELSGTVFVINLVPNTFFKKFEHNLSENTFGLRSPILYFQNSKSQKY